MQEYTVVNFTASGIVSQYETEPSLRYTVGSPQMLRVDLNVTVVRRTSGAKPGKLQTKECYCRYRGASYREFLSKQTFQPQSSSSYTRRRNSGHPVYTKFISKPLNHEDGNDRLSRNVGKQLPNNAVCKPRSVKTSTQSSRIFFLHFYTF